MDNKYNIGCKIIYVFFIFFLYNLIVNKISKQTSVLLLLKRNKRKFFTYTLRQVNVMYQYSLFKLRPLYEKQVSILKISAIDKEISINDTTR